MGTKNKRDIPVEERLRLEKLRNSTTPLRKRFLENMQLHNYSECTINRYYKEALFFIAHFWRDPAKITDDEIREYLRHVREKYNLGSGSIGAIHGALLFLYERTLQEERPVLNLYRSKKEHKARIYLTPEEVRLGLAKVNDVRYHAALFLIYTCGLRANEALNVEVSDIDSTRGLLNIRHGKGDKGRFVPIPDVTLQVLRKMWITHKHPRLLFPSYSEFVCSPSLAGVEYKRIGCLDRPIKICTLRACWQQCIATSGCRKKANLHSLRHSYATNLLEEGIPLITLKENLGHRSIITTSIYSHQTSKLKRDGARAVETLAENAMSQT